MANNILLVDMNAFFASVHQALEPELRGKPVVVCGDPNKRHGIVLAASYEAKKYGIKTAMPNWEAKQLLPKGIFVKPNYKKYTEFSAHNLQIMRDYSPLVQPFSIDEAFIDLAGCQKLFGTGIEVAKMIKERIRDEVGILCSVGIGPNKLIAKMASKLHKPDGLTLVTKEEVPKKFWPLPVRELFGVGSSTEKKLHFLGMRTIGDLAKYPVHSLEKRFGIVGRVLYQSANGIDHSPVNPCSLDIVKSIGNQFTLTRDYVGYEEVGTALLDIAEQVGYRVRQGGYAGKTVCLTLRGTDMQFSSWSMSLPEHTDLTEDIYLTAITLLKRQWPNNKKVRLVGVSLSNLIKNEFEQISLLAEKEKLRRLNRACDRIKEQFGYDSIRRCKSLTEAGIFNAQQSLGRTPGP